MQEALASGKPFLGICLGEQLLFEKQRESPRLKGLGYFKGQVKKIVTPLQDPPHGLEPDHPVNPSPLMKDADGQYVYFVHSYHAVPEDPGIITSVCEYGAKSRPVWAGAACRASSSIRKVQLCRPGHADGL